jgi:hypothetical protein
MRKVAATVLLLIALVLPVLLFWQLASLSSMSGLVAGAIGVAAGWMLNLAWAFATQAPLAGGPPQAGTGNLKIAAAFGWVCPTVLVALTWLVVRFVT